MVIKETEFTSRLQDGRKSLDPVQDSSKPNDGERWSIQELSCGWCFTNERRRAKGSEDEFTCGYVRKRREIPTGSLKTLESPQPDLVASARRLSASACTSHRWSGRVFCKRLQLWSERLQASQKVHTRVLQALAARERALASWLLECTSLDVLWASACRYLASACKVCSSHKSGQKCIYSTPTSNDDNSQTVTRFSSNFGHDAYCQVNNIGAKFYNVRTSGRCPFTENQVDARNDFAWLCLNT